MKKHQKFHGQKHNWFLGLLCVLALVAGPMWLITKISDKPGKSIQLYSTLDGVSIMGLLIVALVIFLVIRLIAGVTVFDVFLMTMLYLVIHFSYEYGYLDLFDVEQQCPGTIVQIKRNGVCQ